MGTARRGKISLQDAEEGDAGCPCQCSGLALGTARRWTILSEDAHDAHVQFADATRVPPISQAKLSQTGVGEDGLATPKTRAKASYLLQTMGVQTSCSHRAAGKEPGKTDIFLSAARAGNFKQLIEAIADGADIFASTLRGQSALMLAAASTSEGTMAAVKFLLEVRIEIEAKDDKGWTALLYACRNKNSEILQFLLDQRAELGVTTNAGETAPMLLAFEPDSDRLVISLLEKRAAMAPRDERGYSLLFVAVDLRRDELTKWLLKKKANARERAVDQTTALMIAASAGNIDIGKRLFESKASVNSKNLKGYSPIMFSLMALEEPFSAWLMDSRADVLVTADNGDTPLEFALAGDLVAIGSRIEQVQRKHAALKAAEAELVEEQRRERELAQNTQAAMEAAQAAAAGPGGYA